MSSYVSGNDDDLFDYEPEETSSESYTSASQYHDLLNDIKDNVSSSDDLNTDKARLSIAFAHALHKFTDDTKADAFHKSVAITLDKLTQGDYSLIRKFYELELSISRRMQFIALFNQTFDNIDLNDDFAKDLFKFLNIDITHTYLHSCYRTLIHITNHALTLDRYVYRSLSERLNIPVHQYLFDDPLQVSESHNIYYEHYDSHVHEKIYRSIATHELLEKLSQDTETKVTFIANDLQS